jgi:hypothetical protein
MESLALGIVRKSFGILGSHKRETTQLISHCARQNLPSTLCQVCRQQSLVSKHTGWEFCSGFISNTMLPLAWIGEVLGSQSTWLANWKVLWRQKRFKSSGKQ